MDIRDWPFKGKPATNAYVQVTTVFVSCTAGLALVVTWPVLVAPALLCFLAWCSFKAGRFIYRDIRGEWRE